MFVRVSRCWTSVPFQSSTRSPVKLHHVTYTFRPGPPAWKRKSGRRLQGVRFLRIQRIAVNRRFIQWEQKLYWTHPGKLVRWSDAQTSSCCWFVLSRALSMFLHWIRSRSASATGNRLRSSQNACFFLLTVVFTYWLDPQQHHHVVCEASPMIDRLMLRCLCQYLVVTDWNF